MSAVRISRIKLQDIGGETQFILGKPSIHSRSNTIYLPVPIEGKLVKINTDDDKVVGSMERTGWVTEISVCEDRGMVFEITGDRKQVTAFKAGEENSGFSMDINVFPRESAFHNDRDLLLVLGSVNPPPDPDRTLDLYRFPEGNHLGTLEIQGSPVSLKYDDLEDLFMVLTKNPNSLVSLRPEGRGKLSVVKTLNLPPDEPLVFETCPSDKRIVVGTSTGKLLSLSADSTEPKVIASFREQISGLIFNPLLDHLYITFKNSRYLSILDLESRKVRETIKCSAEISSAVFDGMHNKFYVFMENNRTVEVYLEQGR